MPEKGEERCVVCDEAITNPICPECIRNEIEHWLGDFKPFLALKLKGYSGIFGTYRHDASKCVVCGNGMAVCAHCVCKEILDEIGAQIEGIEEGFMRAFNYELMTEAG